MSSFIRNQTGPARLPTIPAVINFAYHRIAVIVPAYNEERFIGSVLLKICQYPVDIVVVDDGSTDGTAAISEVAGAIVVRLPHNQGKGAALNAGFSAARKLDPDAIIVIDGDGQHRPEEMMQLVFPILCGQADITVGSRYLCDTSNTPLERRWGHKLFNVVTSLCSGVYVSDSQSGFRAFSRKAYQNITFHSDGFSVESEMQFIAHDMELTLQEVPVTILYTGQGKRSVIEHGLSVMNGILRLVSWYRPLLFFGLPGVLTTLIGIVWGLTVIQRFSDTGQLPVGNALVSVLFTLVGVVAFSTGITLHSLRELLIELLYAKQRSGRDE